MKTVRIWRTREVRHPALLGLTSLLVASGICGVAAALIQLSPGDSLFHGLLVFGASGLINKAEFHIHNVRDDSLLK